jgi:hypothetical protein
MISLLRSLSPVVLAVSTLVGSLGVSSVASAEERVVVTAPAPVAERAPGFRVARAFHGPRWGFARRGVDRFRGFRGWGRFHGRR